MQNSSIPNSGDEKPVDANFILCKEGLPWTETSCQFFIPHFEMNMANVCIFITNHGLGERHLRHCEFHIFQCVLYGVFSFSPFSRNWNNVMKINLHSGDRTALGASKLKSWYSCCKPKQKKAHSTLTRNDNHHIVFLFCWDDMLDLTRIDPTIQSRSHGGPLFPNFSGSSLRHHLSTCLKASGCCQSFPGRVAGRFSWRDFEQTIASPIIL